MPERGNDDAEKATKKSRTEDGPSAEGDKKSPGHAPMGGGDRHHTPMGGGESELNPSAGSKVEGEDADGDD